jgi:hypothetical protein
MFSMFLNIKFSELIQPNLMSKGYTFPAAPGWQEVACPAKPSHQYETPRVDGIRECQWLGKRGKNPYKGSGRVVQSPQ